MEDYKRLTEKEEDWFDTNLHSAEVYNRLAELEDKIENGTLIEVDNKVYPPNKSIGVWGDYCSKCGGLIGENGYEENYCSHCGAKLKEQENE